MGGNGLSACRLPRHKGRTHRACMRHLESFSFYRYVTCYHPLRHSRVPIFCNVFGNLNNPVFRSLARYARTWLTGSNKVSVNAVSNTDIVVKNVEVISYIVWLRLCIMQQL
jgi:hypothetical protein